MIPWREAHRQAGEAAAQGVFPRVVELARAALTGSTDKEAFLAFGALLLDCGLLTEARTALEWGSRLAPHDAGFPINLANLAREEGRHADSRHIYAQLAQVLPDTPVIRRNLLVSLEYDPGATDAERFEAAREWGRWAEARVGGPHPAPPLAPLADRPLRVGYLSADLCQHTVGLFLKDVLAAHDPARILPFAYHARPIRDWVTEEIARAATFRDVTHLDDDALAQQIRRDGIDVLVDLSGHTAGSRLTVFPLRPAPLQVSWLGYFATTGLECLDGVLLDQWHVPPGAPAWFTEPVVRLPQRLCYTPVPFAPPVAPPPRLERGSVTFGCFNNTAKLNGGVLDLWAAILQGVPGSRLILKWRTFNDTGLRQVAWREFGRRGVDPARIELRGPSFHVDLLKEYGEIDVALDPFPFTGGLTSCEALWMGVPVVTWPRSRVVSRQTHAFLGAMGVAGWSARDGREYVEIGVELARRGSSLAERQGLRERMAGSPLCDVAGFTRSFEEALWELARQREGAGA